MGKGRKKEKEKKELKRKLARKLVEEILKDKEGEDISEELLKLKDDKVELAELEAIIQLAAACEIMKSRPKSDLTYS